MGPFIVTEKAMRPASKERRCFYCAQAIGASHLDTCVLINRKVRMKLEIEYIDERPAYWDRSLIEGVLEVSGCWTNELTAALAYVESVGCGCSLGREGKMDVNFVGFVDEPPYLDEE